MTYKIAVVNGKGGVGKTMVATNLAGELALRGYNVGVVDTDSQGNAANYLGVQPEDGLYRALVGVQNGDSYQPAALADVVRLIPTDSYYAPLPDGREPQQVGTIYLLPSHSNTFRIPYLLDDVDAFDALLDEMGDTFKLDYIIIDTAPTLSLFDGSIYAATDGFLYVSECEIGSLLGLSESVRRVERMQKHRQKRGLPPMKILGVVPNKFNRLKEHIENVNAMGQAFPGLVFPMIHLLKTFTRATKFGQTVRAVDARSPAAGQITELVERTLSAIVEVR
jgi:chromosome partitioning protein